MGIFDFFFKKKLQDDFFGELEYHKVKDAPSENYYTGKADFNGRPILVNLTADESGPTNAQKGFFVAVRDNYAALKEEAIIPYVKRELAREGKPAIIDFDAEFVPDEIEISRLDSSPLEWYFVLEAVKLEDWILIEFKDMVPQDTK